MRARARTATPEEKPELWSIMTKEWPDYDRYQQRTDRETPVVILEPPARTLMKPTPGSILSRAGGASGEGGGGLLHR